MTREELIAKIEHFRDVPFDPLIDAIRAVVELHKPKIITNIHSGKKYFFCSHCLEERGDYMSPQEVSYPCSTIQAIEKELQ